MDHTPDREEEMATAAPEVTWTPAYQLDEDGEDYVVRIPTSMITRDRLERLLQWIEFEHLKRGSQLTEEDVAELAREVKHAVYLANRHRVEGP
jgi:hypothetical protein